MLVALAVEGHERQQRQVAPVVVETVEQSQLLVAVGRVFGGVQIQGDQLALAAVEPMPVMVDDRLGEGFTQPVQIDPATTVLEAAEGWLGGEVVAEQGIPVQQSLCIGSRPMRATSLVSP